MKELDDFTVERLAELAKNGGYTDHKVFTVQDAQQSEIISLAKIALAVKGAEPSHYVVTKEYADSWGLDTDRNIYLTELDALKRKDDYGGEITPLYSVPQPADNCQWTYDEHDYKWDSACGESWQFTDGGPEDNGVKFCQSCGKPVELPASPKGE